MKYVRIISPAFLLCMPLFAVAADTFNKVIGFLSTGLNTIIIFLFLVATVIFLFGVVRYISAGGEEDKQAEARNMIMWGVIFLAVMVAVWGFVNIVLDFIFDSESTILTPNDSTQIPQQ